MGKRLKKFAIITLGCRTNQYESYSYDKQLREMGYIEVRGVEEADICIVNTCSVTASADGRSRQQIRRVAKRHPNAEIIVTGCFAENAGSELLQMKGVSKVVSNRKKESLLSTVFPGEDIPEFSIKNFPEHTRAFVKIQDGCNSFCSYCIIPYVRGRSRSRMIDSIVGEAEVLLSNGYKEIVLTGVNVGDFDGGEKGKKSHNLAALVRILDEMPGLERIRISSIDPNDVDDDLFDAIIHGKKTCQSMHLVLQSGSNSILKRMNRKYTKEIFYDTVFRLYGANADFSLTTDVIVGFPGETDRDFSETLEVVERVKFAKVHVFPYSERERTRAALYPHKVSSGRIKERKEELMRLSNKAAYEFRDRFLNRKMTVLTEVLDDGKIGRVSGHTDNFLKVFLPCDKLRPNELVEVELIENVSDGFLGSLLNKL